MKKPPECRFRLSPENSPICCPAVWEIPNTTKWKFRKTPTVSVADNSPSSVAKARKNASEIAESVRQKAPHDCSNGEITTHQRSRPIGCQNGRPVVQPNTPQNVNCLGLTTYTAINVMARHSHFASKTLFSAILRASVRRKQRGGQTDWPLDSIMAAFFPTGNAAVTNKVRRRSWQRSLAAHVLSHWGIALC